MSGEGIANPIRRHEPVGRRYGRRFQESPDCQAYDPDLTGNTLLLSFMTVAELDRWAIQRNL